MNEDIMGGTSGPADYINIQTGEVLDPDFKVFPPSRPWRFIVSVQGVRELLRSHAHATATSRFGTLTVEGDSSLGRTLRQSLPRALSSNRLHLKDKG